jgi:hypothetical protein
MSAIKFKLLVKDSPHECGYESGANRIKRYVTVIAISDVDAKETYLGLCHRYEIEYLGIESCEVAVFKDLEGEENHYDFFISERARVQPFIEEIEPFPANCNPFHHDAWSMGSDLVRGWMAMHDGYDREGQHETLDRLYLVNSRSGRRVRVHLNEKKPEVKE